MKPEEIIQELTQVTKADDVYQIVSRYRLHRTLAEGINQDVEVEIRDYGAKVKREFRYICSATSDDGRVALGNHGSSIQEALSEVHWDRLDLPN